MRFEKFIRKGKSGIPQITISNLGRISFNDSAVRLLDLAERQHMELSFARDERVIGMQCGRDKTRYSVKLRFGATGAQISAKRFLDYFGVDYSKTRRYPIGHYDGYATADLAQQQSKGQENAN